MIAGQLTVSQMTASKLTTGQYSVGKLPDGKWAAGHGCSIIPYQTSQNRLKGLLGPEKMFQLLRRFPIKLFCNQSINPTDKMGL